MKDWLIIDGYNLLHHLTAESRRADLAGLRKNLITLLEPLVNAVARRITIVFDGQLETTPNKEIESELIEVVYTPAARTADSLIEHLVCKAEHPENILVVTSDRLERDAAGASGADTMASSLFVAMIKEQHSDLSAKIKKFNQQHENITLGDFFPGT